MTDYAVKVSVRNNRILRALRESGYESQMDFCRKTGFPQGELNQLVNMRRPAYGRWGGWANPAHKLALLLGLEPEDLFTQRQGQGLEVNAVEVEMTECQVCGILGQSDSIEALEARQEVSKLISYLTDREKGVIRARMEGETLDEIGEVYGVNKERIRQIEQKAMRKMKIRMVKGDNAAEQGMPISMIYH